MVAVLTDGAASHSGSRLYPPAKLADLREREVVTAVGILGLPPERLMLLREPDGHAPHKGVAFDAVVDRVRAVPAGGRLHVRRDDVAL